MYIGKNGKGLEEADQEQGPVPTNMKAQAARMAATVVPTTNMVSKPSSSSAPATGAPMARASSTPAPGTSTTSAVGPTAPPAATPIGGMAQSGYAGGMATAPQGRTSLPIGAGMPQTPPNFDQQAQDALQGMYGAHVDPTADKAQAQHQSQVNNANLMARMGASGFGTSGASGVLSSNIQADLARQLAQLDNQAAITNSQLSGNALNAGLGQRSADRSDAALQAGISAGVTGATGFTDTNRDGKDDVTGLTSSQINSGLGVSNLDATRKSLPLDQGLFDHAGSQNKPFVLQPNELAAVQAAGWRHLTVNYGGRPVDVYQDPVNGSFYAVSPDGAWSF